MRALCWATSESRWSRRDLSQAAHGVDPGHRNAPVPLVEGEPVLHVAALVGVVDQDVRLRHAGHAEGLGQRGLAAKEGADVAGQVRADVGRVADGVGGGDHVRRGAGRAEQRAVVLGEVDAEAEAAQQLGGPHARAPGDLGRARPGRLVQLLEVGGHELPHRPGRADLLDGSRLLLRHAAVLQANLARSWTPPHVPLSTERGRLPNPGRGDAFTAMSVPAPREDRARHHPDGAAGRSGRRRRSRDGDRRGSPEGPGHRRWRDSSRVVDHVVYLEITLDTITNERTSGVVTARAPSVFATHTA